MTKKEKAKLVADLLNGKIYLCKECGEYHKYLILMGNKIKPWCSKNSKFGGSGQIIIDEYFE